MLGGGGHAVVQDEDWLEGDPDGKMPVGLEMLRQMEALIKRRFFEGPGRDLDETHHLVKERLMWHTLLPLAREWDLSVDIVRFSSQALVPAKAAALDSSGQLHGASRAETPSNPLACPKWHCAHVVPVQHCKHASGSALVGSVWTVQSGSAPQQ